MHNDVIDPNLLGIKLRKRFKRQFLVMLISHTFVFFHIRASAIKSRIPYLQPSFLGF